MARRKFEEGEIVRVVAPIPDNREALNLTGEVVGFATDEDGAPTFGVLLEKIERVWVMKERELASTGLSAPKRRDSRTRGPGS